MVKFSPPGPPMQESARALFHNRSTALSLRPRPPRSGPRGGFQAILLFHNSEIRFDIARFFRHGEFPQSQRIIDFFLGIAVACFLTSRGHPGIARIITRHMVLIGGAQGCLPSGSRKLTASGSGPKQPQHHCHNPCAVHTSLVHEKTDAFVCLADLTAYATKRILRLDGSSAGTGQSAVQAE